MEVVHRCKASKVSLQGGEDVISTMPDDVIANIMDRLPVQDAVRTSILSTSWRFMWTLLTQVTLDIDFFMILLLRKVHFDKTISRLLLQLKGGVTTFNLFIGTGYKIDDEDIHHWIMLLSRIRGFKALTLINRGTTLVELPTHLFSGLELKLLKLYRCVLSLSPSFRGFPKLLSLHLDNVSIQDNKFGELIAQCPLLETLEIRNRFLREELMAQLCLSFRNCKLLPECFTRNPVSTTFPFLKTLTLFRMNFSSVSMLSCAFRMLFGCPNLQNLCIEVVYRSAAADPIPVIFSPEVDCTTTGRLQLRNVNLASIKGLENEVCLIKYMLAYSPMLKSIEILLNSVMERNGKEKYKLELASKLLKFRRASPMAKIII